MIKKWVYRELPPADKVAALSTAINVNNFLSSILLQRGVNSFEEAKNFFRPAIEHLHDPFLMKDMNLAVDRIEKAIRQEEKILIYGDYDVDGSTAVALVYGFLREIYPDVSYYIPDRYHEGYGISEKGIREADAKGIGLIISLDCGIKAITQSELAESLGIDLIICDHHLPGSKLPAASAILDPKQDGCAYPYKELTGCGVGFKLLQAYCQQSNLDPKLLFKHLDLVVISIASDIVPMTGENRILAHFGLKVITAGPRPGIKALMKISGFTKIDISNIVFGLAPRINACGRMDHANGAVELMLAKTDEEATQMAELVDGHNSDRKKNDQQVTREALSMIDSDVLLADACSTVLYKEGWHKGVIGIVASRCIEKYYRPTIILTQIGTKLTGSARSVAGFNVYKAIEKCRHLLDQFGGHKYAAGLTLDVNNFKEFQEMFELAVAESIKDEQLQPELVIDLTLDLERLSEKFFNILRQMEPFGPENMTPVFSSKHLEVVGRPRVLKNEHLKFSVRSKKGGRIFDAIGFGLANFFEELAAGKQFELAYCIEESEYKDKKSLQLRVKDIRFVAILKEHEVTR